MSKAQPGSTESKREYDMRECPLVFSSPSWTREPEQCSRHRSTDAASAFTNPAFHSLSHSPTESLIAPHCRSLLKRNIRSSFQFASSARSFRLLSLPSRSLRSPEFLLTPTEQVEANHNGGSEAPGCRTFHERKLRP